MVAYFMLDWGKKKMNREMKDVMQWAETENGIFFVKSLYNNTFNRGKCFFFTWRGIWESQVQPKISLFT